MGAKALTKDVAMLGDDEITIARRIAIPAAARAEYVARATTKIAMVDARLLAIARGDVEPEPHVDLSRVDDPFGGLIPVDEDEAIEISDEWLEEVPADLYGVRKDAIPFSAVPRIVMETSRLVALPLDHRSGFLLSHIDGVRSYGEIIDVANLSPEDTFEVLMALVGLGALAID